MLEFINTPSCNQYYLVNRINDCEKNLTSFNYATPMAICIEAMLKNILYEYDKTLSEEEIEDRKLSDLLRDQYLRNLLEKNFNISSRLLDNIDHGIRVVNNQYKHSLKYLVKPSLRQKKDYFYQFFIFASKYYEHFSEKKAPDWDDSLFDSLIETEISILKNKQERLLKAGIQNEH